MNTYNSANDSVVSTDEEEEEVADTPFDQVDAHYPDDDEFDSFESGLNDFNFDDTIVDEGEPH